MSEFERFYNEPRWQTNIAIGYQVTEALRAAVGATNLFDAYPNHTSADTVYAGVARYEQVGQGIGVNRGTYYASLNYRF